MFARSDLQARGFASLAILSLAASATLCGCATSNAPRTLAEATPSSAAPAPVNVADSDMPDDLGVPLPQAAPPKANGRVMSIDAPISSIAAAPAGKAVLDHDLPGLCERPEFGMFKGMSLKALASMSGGKITTAKLNQVQADLVKINYTTAAVGPETP